MEEATIGANARIGPYARIRPGTQPAEDVHVGNFVEVKASSMGRGSKTNHLAYVGDATVGRDVNIGAGTITCNYDGAHKHRTVIEDDVHIGSDVQLVAPVTIGKGATMAAGAITDDVPRRPCALTQKKQLTKPGWRRPGRSSACRASAGAATSSLGSGSGVADGDARRDSDHERDRGEVPATAPRPARRRYPSIDAPPPSGGGFVIAQVARACGCLVLPGVCARQMQDYARPDRVDH